MHYFIIIVMILDFVILIKGVKAILKEKEDRKWGIVTMSKSILQVGVGLLSLSSTLLIFSILTKAHTDEILVILLLTLICDCIMISYFNCRILYDKDGFLVKNFFGIQRQYQYRDITYINRTKEIGIGTKEIYLKECEEVVGGELFLSYASEKYEEYYGTQASEKLSKYDIFNGNIKNPREYIMAYTLIYLMLFLWLVVIIVLHKPKLAEHLEYKTITIEFQEVRGKQLRFYTEDDELYYQISDYEEVLVDKDTFIESCTNSSQYRVGVKSDLERDGECYQVYTIERVDGTVYLTLDRVNDKLKENGIKWCIFILSVTVLWTGIVWISVYVGRNLEKFQKFQNRKM